MATGHPLSRLSFRWQIILLGALVVVLSISVLLAIAVTLRYTKSAVLKDEKERLTATARNLAQEYEDRAEAARRNNQPPLLEDAGSTSAQDVLGLLSRVVLQNGDASGGGFYSLSKDSLVPYFPPDSNGPRQDVGDQPGSLRDTILEVTRRAASSHQPAEQVIWNAPGVVLIEAVPVHDGYHIAGSAWSLKRLPELPGANRFRAYMIIAGLGATALASVLLTLLVIRNLQGGVHKIKGSLKSLEGNLTAETAGTDEPREIQDILLAINRLGCTLKEKIKHEKEFENQLRHSERLASLGRLVAGVAHEVRNPLATIRLRVQMCGRESENPRVRESCTVALQEIERLNGMVNRLLNFARPVQLQLQPVDLRNFVEERMDSFKEIAARCRVALVTDFSGESSALAMDRSRMAQVFDNIIQNAIESMADTGGTLTVNMTSHKKMPEQNHGVCVEFRDTGRGMPPTVLTHVFDPFFTTKASGTGLGLSICHELVRAHGGDIRVESLEGKGTSVYVTVPVVQPSRAEQQTAGQVG